MLHSQAVETLYKAMLARLKVREEKGLGGAGEGMLIIPRPFIIITLDLVPLAAVSRSCS